MLDTESYGEWNPFVEKAECASPRRSANRSCCTCAGPTGVRRPAPSGSASSTRPTTRAAYDGPRWPTSTRDSPRSSAWCKGTRYQRLSQEPGGPTRYDTVEEFSGPLVEARRTGARRGRVPPARRGAEVALRGLAVLPSAPGHANVTERSLGASPARRVTFACRAVWPTQERRGLVSPGDCDPRHWPRCDALLHGTCICDSRCRRAPHQPRSRHSHVRSADRAEPPLAPRRGHPALDPHGRQADLARQPWRRW